MNINDTNAFAFSVNNIFAEDAPRVPVVLNPSNIDTETLLAGENFADMSLSLCDKLALLRASSVRTGPAPPGNIDFFNPECVSYLGAMQREELADARYFRKWGAARPRPPAENSSPDEYVVRQHPLHSAENVIPAETVSFSDFGYMSTKDNTRVGPPKFFHTLEGTAERLADAKSGWRPAKHWGVLSSGVFRYMSPASFLVMAGPASKPAAKEFDTADAWHRLHPNVTRPVYELSGMPEFALIYERLCPLNGDSNRIAYRMKPDFRGVPCIDPVYPLDKSRFSDEQMGRLTYALDIVYSLDVGADRISVSVDLAKQLPSYGALFRDGVTFGPMLPRCIVETDAAFSRDGAVASGINWGFMMPTGAFTPICIEDIRRTWGNAESASNKRALATPAGEDCSRKRRAFAHECGISSPSPARDTFPHSEQSLRPADEGAGLGRIADAAHDEAAKQSLVRKQYFLTRAGTNLEGLSFKRARDKIRATEMAHIKMLLLADSCAKHSPRLKAFMAKGVASLGEGPSTYRDIVLEISSHFMWKPTHVHLAYYDWRSGTGFGLNTSGVERLNAAVRSIYAGVESARVLLDQHAAECAEKCISKSECELAAGAFIAEFMGFGLDVREA